VKSAGLDVETTHNICKPSPFMSASIESQKARLLSLPVSPKVIVLTSIIRGASKSRYYDFNGNREAPARGIRWR
jgi:hypothetical protein